tara:strand:+ start:5842 stop:6129 length:288 start_codon:yes stop_codon:yes gene_type:complete
MKSGDLVTLSSYALQSAPMWKWKQMVWTEKKPLVGLIIRVEDNPWGRKFTSKNEKKFYFVKWIQDGPASRFGRSFHKTDGYFLRNDLKYFKKGQV